MLSHLQIVWLKKDLRIQDHRPLFAAARSGHPVLILYIYEPEIVGAEDFDPSHLVFINQSLAELDARLRAAGGRLTCRVGPVPDVFDQLHAEHGIAHLWSHEETGNALSYARDRRVKGWCRAHGVPWTEIPQHGVARPHPTRDGWAERWTARMSEPITPAPTELCVIPAIEAGRIQSPADLGLPGSTKDLAQPGGESHGTRLLHSFLERRGVDYRRAMSAPCPRRVPPGPRAAASARTSPTVVFRCGRLTRSPASVRKTSLNSPPPGCPTTAVGGVPWFPFNPACAGIATSFRSWKTNPRWRPATFPALTMACVSPNSARSVSPPGARAARVIP